jgi:2-polyprenyl-6-methoxyphenol hydroxylase-like FAD-dependent oxidoreductase
MASTAYDITIVGGGLAGSALAKGMAEHGARVLVLEREMEFRDRVRGEAIMPWGVPELRALGLYDTVLNAGGHPLAFWDGYQDGSRSGHRNLERTTPCREPVLACFHPNLQEALLQAAIDAGAEVRRGARLLDITANGNPSPFVIPAPAVIPAPLVVPAKAGIHSMTVAFDGRTEVVSARLVVGADGRTSQVRTLGGFQVRHDPDGNMVAGILLDGVTAPDDATLAGMKSENGLFVLLFPQGNGQARAYVCFRAQENFRLQGQQDLARFRDLTIQAGAPAEFYADAQPVGPLATFSGAAVWVDKSYRNGIALVGDAAAVADPTWGQGLSMALANARELRDQLIKHDDWNEAGEAYAEAWRQLHQTIHTAETWATRLLLETGPEADERRLQAFSLWREDRTRNPDTFLSGPVQLLDETARRRYFGEE